MANQDPNQNHQDPKTEIPGDTNAGDIVGRTGEEMPRQSHDGLEADDRERNANSTGANNPDKDRVLDDPRTGPIAD